MKIRDVLNAKPSRALVSVAPGTGIRDVLNTLAAEKIGTVVVSPDGKAVAGILSERDIVRAMARTGAEVLNGTVDEFMTANVITCAPDEPLDGVLATMTDGRFRHMPVVEDGALIGLITLGDAVKARLDELAYESDAMKDMIMGH